jgi:16S rRNA (adenine1518-N6/adenine1519-N6)-dimethyltransferase
MARARTARLRSRRLLLYNVFMNLRELCKKYGIDFKKRLGQNLLLDDNINRIMTDAAALSAKDYVVEVGAGLGALTRYLAVEIDPSFMPALEDQFGAMENVKLFRGDILNHSLPKLIDEFIPGGETYKMVSNLPYYITTPILFHFLESPRHFERLVVMVQEEVALRMASKINTREYGILALALNLYSEIDIVHRVPRTCFVPQPKVDSAVVRIRLRDKPLYPDLEPKFLMGLVRSAFSHRRKTLRNSLTKSGVFGAPQEIVNQAFDATGIDPGRRPQTLSLDEFAALARDIKKHLE